MASANIPQFYANKKILITGGTGFLGKVLLEKLLRSCPAVDKIYLIVRSSRGKSPAERFEEIKKLALFDKLRTASPSSFDKVVLMEGDMSELGLGLSPADYKTLAQNVSIVFHVAASVRFDEHLTDAVKMNARGTREVCQLAMQMKKLMALLYVSTTYCNCDRKVIDEKIYPAHADWEKTIEIIEKVDPAIMNILTPKFIGSLPNTYTFSKSLSEHIISHYEGKLPVIIFRPSIVISSWQDPIAGWIDNFNGPAGLMLGAGKGVIRTAIINPDAVPDYMPVDIACKAIIVAAWNKAVKDNSDKQLTIYNCSSRSKSISSRELVRIAYDAFWVAPMHDILWIPTSHYCQDETVLYFNVLFKHLLPALIADSIFNLSGRKPMLVKLHRKIYKAMLSLSYFTLREWTFKNENFLNLSKAILPDDRESFDYDFSDIDPNEFFLRAMMGGRQYLLHEDMGKLEEARTKAYRMYYFEIFLKSTFVVWVVWLIHYLHLWQSLASLIIMS
ncbi:fatty acyl-CoA reductase 1 [Nilaparvata lugens]|uniref:Fatty acyl-CoA reductase n=1 Tax=Nilaparvata lugens TaxID=108931 RepID=A0A3S7L472_NILLU|nr:fatty acyl-CoA reductase 1 [Nilaparvata lugens]XP_022197928.2 fatty acyl-CoA reductase 1 [Nilaparvata lugens]AWJ25023.1 fatty acyl-CoA reductase [Nilaparvata lugens]